MNIKEEASGEAFEMLQSIFLAAPIGIGFLVNRVFAEVNPKFSEITGYSKEEVIGNNALMLYPSKEEYDFVGEEKYRQIREKGSGSVETKWRRKDGIIIDILLSSTPFDPSDHGKGVTFTALDITDRKLAQDKVREKDIQFRKLSANVPDLIYQFTRSPDGKYTVPIASAGIINIFGCSPEDVTDDFGPIAKVIHPDDAARVFDDIENSAKDLSYFTCEFRVLLPGMPVQWILSKSTPERLPDGSITWYGFNVNITNSKKSGEQLFKLSRAVEQSSNAIIITDVKGVIEYANPAATELTGYPNEELTGSNTRVLKSGEHTLDYYSHLWSTISSGKKWVGEFHNRRKDGELYWQATTISPIINESGEVVNYLAIKKDVTQEKRMAAELTEAKEKAEESDRLKSAFLANMSHEIRTPMNGILGFSNLLKEQGLTGDQQQEYIQIIEKSGARMLNIINDITEIAKIESGLMNVTISQTSINEQVDYIYNLLSPDAEAKRVLLLCKKPLFVKDSIINTDREKLYAILSNLVKNAIKFTSKGSIEFGYTKGEEFLEFFVKDTGIGVPLTRQKAIFERFVQADILNIKASQGAGLGLSISKAYVEMLGGKIWVESVEGEGSTFFFTLPLCKDKKSKGHSKNLKIDNNMEESIGKLKILIAEDDETSELLLEVGVRKICKEMLKTRSGIDAVNICRANPDIDLVFMDIQMPGMNGYEATRQIRTFNKDIVIIAQTAYGLSGDREKSIEAGCNDYISKPICISDLLILINKNLNLAT
ncbi:MAG: PAS domain S-box protein [Bacteroidales bacterium]|nr:PAS domain S-box protein [Bacteroidales bacterium]